MEIKRAEMKGEMIIGKDPQITEEEIIEGTIREMMTGETEGPVVLEGGKPFLEKRFADSALKSWWLTTRILIL